MEEQQIDANAVIDNLVNQVAQQAKQIAMLQAVLQGNQEEAEEAV